MSVRLPHHIRHLLAVGALAVAIPGVPVLLAGPAATSTLGGTEAAVGDGGVPADVERHVAGDMVVDWIGGAPEGAAEALTSSGVPVELAVPALGQEPTGGPDHTEEYAAASAESDGDLVEHHAAAGGGYALFSTSARWLPGGYTIRLAGGDGRIEQYRSAAVEAARAASDLTGAPVRVAASSGGPVDPARGEIVAVLGSGPCGDGAVGCGGPGLTDRELLWGRVWIAPSALTLSPAEASNLAAHELGHALGLQHFGDSWSDGRQVMYPTITGAASYRTGDGAGLRHMAGGNDRPAGTVTSRTYAAGRAHVAGTVSSGSRVRIAAGSVVSDVTATDGRFSGSIPLPAGTHQVCASSLDAAPGFTRGLGCAAVEAPGRPVAHGDGVYGSFETIRLSGWAIDPQTSGAVTVEVRRNGVSVATVLADQARSDLGKLAAHYGTEHGFALDIPAEAGRNRVCVRILGIDGGGDLEAGCAVVNHPVDPVGALDRVTSDGLSASVSGWTLDPNSPDPLTISVSVDGEAPLLGATARASGDRPDVARNHAAHGADVGFDHQVALLPGRHQVCVTALNVGLGQDRSLGCAEVVVQDPVAAAVSVTSSAVADVVDTVLDTVGAPVEVLRDLEAVTTLTR